jgi:ribosomal protein S18 acetylase RimI-like enzyme
MVAGFKMRKAQPADMQAVYNLSNDFVVRKNSIHQEMIPFEIHEKWFNVRLADSDTLFYVVEVDDGRLAGQVRFQKEAGVWVISISVAPDFRGQHLGDAFLSEPMRLSKVSPVRAVVRCDNIPSLMLFERNGFSRENSSEIDHDFISLIWSPLKERSE